MRKKIKKTKKTKKVAHHPYLGLTSIIFFLFCLLFTTLYPSSIKIENKSPKPQVVIRKIVKTYPIPAQLQIPILTYHYVEFVKDKKDTIRQSLNITPDVFALQLLTLKNDGYTFITAVELADVMDGKKLPPPKPIVLTFDDGYEDFYTDVFPVLKKYNIKAVAYIIPGFINQANYMSGTQIQEIIDSGIVEIGAHTVHHVYLKNMNKDAASQEIIDSKNILEATYHVPVVSFAYPYGAFDNQAIEIVKQAGFRTAVSTIPGILESEENRFTLYRVRPGVRTEQYLIGYLMQPHPQVFQ